MGIQGSLDAVVKAFVVFYLGCVLIGRPDIPFKVIAGLQAKSVAGLNSKWGCPSAFNKGACKTYDPQRYRKAP